MAQAYERWSERSLTKSPKGWTAQRVYDVLYATSATDALGASGLPAENSSHPQNAALKVDSLTAESPGFTVWVVRVSYSIPEAGSDHTGPGDTDPLLAPVEIEWTQSIVSKPVERDINGAPIINSAGSPYNPPSQREFYQWGILVLRNEPFYNFATARAFQGKVNSNQFTSGGYLFPIGCLKCTSILPAGRFKVNATYIPIGYKFEFLEYDPYVTSPSVALSPFQLYLPDQGFSGWYNDGTLKPGKFVDGDGTEAADAVRLDGHGAPIDSKWKVGAAKNSAVAPSGITPAGQLLTPPGGQLNLLVYQNCAGADFSLLNL